MAAAPNSTSGRGDRPEEEGFSFKDHRKVDPLTGAVREPSPEEAVIAEAEAAVAGADDENAQLAAERLEQLQRVSAALVNKEAEFTAYVKRTKADAAAAYTRGVGALAEGLIPVLDDVELARQHGDLTGPFASIAEKLEQILEHFGVERYGAAGEVFDPMVHEALMHGHSADVTATTVQQVLQPGYRTGDRVLRPARVAVVDPE